MRTRACIRMLLVAAVAAGATTVMPARAASADPGCATGTSSAELHDLFASGITGLVGGDYARPMPLGPDRVVWMFQDAFVGTPTAARLSDGSFTHNAALLQEGLCMRVVGAEAGPAVASFFGAHLEEHARHWFWSLDGELGADGNLHVFVAEMVNPNGTGAAFGAEPVAVWRAVVHPDTLSVVSFSPAPDSGTRPLYGFSVASDAAWSYLYGNCYRQFTDPTWYRLADRSCNTHVYVARVPRGRFGDRPAYWNGTEWTADRAAAVPVSSAGTSAHPLQVTRAGDGRWIGVSKPDDWWGGSVELSIARRPTGPFARYAEVPLPPRCDGCNTYFATPTPWPTASGGLQLATSNHTWDLALADSQPALYRPSVIDAPAPPPGPAHVRIEADDTVSLQIAGRGGLPPDTRTVAATVTATNADGRGYVTVWPCGIARPHTSALNVLPRRDVANEVVVGLGDGGRLCLWSDVDVDLIVDVQGHANDRGGFRAAVGRLLDTRPGAPTVDGHFAGIGAAATTRVVEVPVAGRAGVPTSARLVVLNVTATDVARRGYVTVWPCGAQPPTSNLNVVPGATTPNLVVVATSATGTVCLRSYQPAQLIVDVHGWYEPTGEVAAMMPVRLTDTRPGTATSDGSGLLRAPLRPLQPVRIQVNGRMGVQGARAVVLNVTVVDAGRAGYLTVWPCDHARPPTSNLNFVAGETRAVLAVSGVAADGTVCAASSDGVTTHFVADLMAWYPATSDVFRTVNPVRLLDARTD